MDRTFRGGASDDFKLSVLMNQHYSYTSLKEQFMSKFEKPIRGLRVERIFKVQVSWTGLTARNRCIRTRETVDLAAFSGRRCRFFGGFCGQRVCRGTRRWRWLGFFFCRASRFVCLCVAAFLQDRLCRPSSTRTRGGGT